MPRYMPMGPSGHGARGRGTTVMGGRPPSSERSNESYEDIMPQEAEAMKKKKELKKAKKKSR